MDKKFYPRTLEEFKRGIDAYTLKTQYPPGDVRRYGAVPDRQSTDE